jgi:hypothetical protein
MKQYKWLTGVKLDLLANGFSAQFKRIGVDTTGTAAEMLCTQLVGDDDPAVVDLGLVPLMDLVPRQSEPCDQIISRGLGWGLKHTPLWLGPQLRILYWEQQPHHEILWIASRPILVAGRQYGWVLTRNNQAPWLSNFLYTGRGMRDLARIKVVYAIPPEPTEEAA